MTAITAMGNTLKMGPTAGALVDIGDVTSYDGPGGSASIIDATHLGSAAKEKRMGLPDEGQFTFELNYDPDSAAHVAITTARAARSLQMFELTLTNNDKATWSGYVTGFKIQGGVDALVTASVTVEITGAVTWPAAVEV